MSQVSVLTRGNDGEKGVSGLKQGPDAASHPRLNRTTEQEGIVVNEGRCELEDPTFSNAAVRLAQMELEDIYIPPWRPSVPLKHRSSFKTSKGQSSSAMATTSSAKSLKSLSDRSLGSTSITQPGSSLGDTVRRSRDSWETDSQGQDHKIDALTQDKDSESEMNSPFGHHTVQQGSPEAIYTGKEAKAMLGSVIIDTPLLTVLSSFSSHDLATYMELVQEAKLATGRCDALRPAQASLETVRSSGDKAELDLNEAVKKLRESLPPAEIHKLECHAAYGIRDVMNAPSRVELSSAP